MRGGREILLRRSEKKRSKKVQEEFSLDCHREKREKARGPEKSPGRRLRENE